MDIFQERLHFLWPVCYAVRMPNEQNIEKVQVKAQVEEPEQNVRAEEGSPLLFDSLFETVYVSVPESIFEERFAASEVYADDEVHSVLEDPLGELIAQEVGEGKSPCGEPAVGGFRERKPFHGEPVDGRYCEPKVLRDEPATYERGESEAFFVFDLMATIGTSSETMRFDVSEGVEAENASKTQFEESDTDEQGSASVPPIPSVAAGVAAVIRSMPVIPSELRASASEEHCDDASESLRSADNLKAEDSSPQEPGTSCVGRSCRNRPEKRVEPTRPSREEAAASAAARAAVIEWRRQIGGPQAEPRIEPQPHLQVESQPQHGTEPLQLTPVERESLSRTPVKGRAIGRVSATQSPTAQPAAIAPSAASKSGRHARTRNDDALAQSARRIRAAVVTVSGVPLEIGMPPVTVMPENAERGKPTEHPVRDEKAKDPDAKFFAAAMSIKEGMEKADRAHSRRIRAWARVIAVVLLVVVGGVGLTAAFNQPLDSQQITEKSSPGSTSESMAPGDAPSEEDESEKHTGRAGTVVYSYTGHVGEGGPYVVTETVEFADDGTSAQTTIEGTFGDAEAAERFLEAVQRDYGSDFLEGRAEGDHVTVKVDISKLSLDREAYEEALRDSVDDLRVVKK